jgi:hypothetical protein
LKELLFLKFSDIPSIASIPRGISMARIREEILKNYYKKWPQTTIRGKM